MNNETIEHLFLLWERVNQEFKSIKLSLLWNYHPPRTKELPRQSIRFWKQYPIGWDLLDMYWKIDMWMCNFYQYGVFGYREDVRFEALILAWQLGEYMQLLHGKTKDSFEELQHLAHAIAAALNEDKPG